jgi:hypothetical protein
MKRKAMNQCRRVFSLCNNACDVCVTLKSDMSNNTRLGFLRILYNRHRHYVIARLPLMATAHNRDHTIYMSNIYVLLSKQQSLPPKVWVLSSFSSLVLFSCPSLKCTDAGAIPHIIPNMLEILDQLPDSYLAFAGRLSEITARTMPYGIEVRAE